MGRGMSAVWIGASLSAFAVLAGPAAAETPETMMAVCRNMAHDALRVRLPDIETKYEGQRVDGTHAVNGRAFKRNATRTFQCSFDPAGRRIVKFVTRRVSEAPRAAPPARSRDERVCLRAVAEETGNRQVATLSVEPSEANTIVMVGVGPARAPWKCLISRGVVAQIMSMTDEGRL